MGLRDKTSTTRKLTIQKETLRKLQLRPLSDDELRAAAGGRSGMCTMDGCAPSHCGC